MNPSARGFSISKPVLIGWVLVGVAFLWVFYGPIWNMMNIWAGGEDYQHGFFVPLFSLFLLWYRREEWDPYGEGGHWWSIPCFFLSALFVWGRIYFNSPSLAMYGIIPAVAGVALLIGGSAAMRWAWPSIVFLLFMIPLPNRVSSALAQQLQTIAAVASTYVIQTLGIPAARQGSIISLSAAQLDVERACSGLRMLTVFFAICVGGAFVIKAPLWEKAVIVASAVPIAIITNVIRITATGVQREFFSNAMLDDAMHRGAGFAMPLIAFALLLLEYKLLKSLFPSVAEDAPLSFAPGDPVGRM